MPATLPLPPSPPPPPDHSEKLVVLRTPVTRLHGVGEAAAAKLAKLLKRNWVVEGASPSPSSMGGVIPTLLDLLFHLPSGITDRRSNPTIAEAPVGETVTLLVTVEKHNPPKSRNGRGPYRITCADATGSLVLVYFNGDREYLKRTLPEGKERAISGKLELYDGVLQMPHPERVALPEELEKLCRIEPVYPLTEGLYQPALQKWISAALERTPELPEWLHGRTGWPAWKAALQVLHQPDSVATLEPDYPARQRLAYDEMLASQLALALLRRQMQRVEGIVIAHPNLSPRTEEMRRGVSLAERLLAQLPFQLTHGQEEVLAEIRSDMASGKRMLRLLQGDVGSGKTVVALLAMLAVVEAGYQAALMVPTEILARQHFATLQSLLAGMGINVLLLSGSLKPAGKKAVQEELAAGRVHVVVGTHALFQQDVVFERLGLAVIDEQHRFGVAQRMALAGKGSHPHLLLMTATPIPRSLTMTYYGDLDSSSLKEKPANRLRIATRAIPQARTEEVIDRVQAAVKEGAKVYWICPLVEPTMEAELTSVMAVESRYKTMRERFGDRVGMVHGRMKGEERETVMQGFAGTAHDILVATTVIEVGVDVPAATIIVIENAERFGLAQLHQLRGRVGRSNLPSSCLLLYQPECTETARERLSILRDHNDGFLIAEEDLRLRGGGDLLGIRQSGLPDYRFVDLYRHRDLMAEARQEAKLILHQYPQLRSERGQALRLLLGLFGHDQSMRLVQGG